MKSRDGYTFILAQVIEMVNLLWDQPENFTPSSQKVRGISVLSLSYVFHSGMNCLKCYVSKNLPKIHVTILGKYSSPDIFSLRRLCLFSALKSKYMSLCLAQERRKKCDLSNPEKKIMFSVTLYNFFPHVT